MVGHVNEVIKCGGDLSLDEQTFFSTAYGNVVRRLRASVGVISKIERQVTGAAGKLAAAIHEYRHSIELELETVCQDVQALFNTTLFPAAVTGSSEVFYYKMQGYSLPT